MNSNKPLGQKETPPTREPFKASRLVTGFEIKTGIGLLIFSAVIPIVTVWWWGRPASFGEFITLIFVGIYMFAVLATFAIIVLWGLGRLDLPGKFVWWLGGATIGEVAVFVTYLLQYILRE